MSKEGKLKETEEFKHVLEIHVKDKVVTLSVAKSNVPSAWIKGCWILTSIPESDRPDLHRADKQNKALTTVQLN